MIGIFLILIATSIVLPSAWAQQASPSVPQIIVSGSAEILLPATKASFSIGIMTSASSANAANEDNARITKSVIEALHGARLSQADIASSRLAVSPRWDYEEKSRRPKRSVFRGS
jgi:hypothetical protein